MADKKLYVEYEVDGKRFAWGPCKDEADAKYQYNDIKGYEGIKMIGIHEFEFVSDNAQIIGSPP
jgi:hypothetical protein